MIVYRKSKLEIAVQIVLCITAAFIGALDGVRPVIMALLSVCLIAVGLIQGFDMGIAAAMKCFKELDDRRGNHGDKN